MANPCAFRFIDIKPWASKFHNKHDSDTATYHATMRALRPMSSIPTLNHFVLDPMNSKY